MPENKAVLFINCTDFLDWSTDWSVAHSELASTNQLGARAPRQVQVIQVSLRDFWGENPLSTFLSRLIVVRKKLLKREIKVCIKRHTGMKRILKYLTIRKSFDVSLTSNSWLYNLDDWSFVTISGRKN